MRKTAVLLLLAAASAGCSSSSSSPTVPTIAPARTFRLADFRPAGPVPAGRPVTVAFTIDQPSGGPLTNYRRGAGPHTGVHVIFVRNDLSTIIHRHPPIGADGRVRDRVVFPAPGPYRVLVDAYPNLPGALRNFQLFGTVDVAGRYRPRRLTGFRPEVDVGGYRVRLQGRPRLRAIEAAFLPVTITGPGGRPARFTPWFGALAHAIFFRAGTLAYFHTHVCGANTPGCTSSVGGPPRPSGTSSRPGRISVGVLLPQPGTWRLFLQFKADGHIITAPFTLRVR